MRNLHLIIIIIVIGFTQIGFARSTGKVKKIKLQDALVALTKHCHHDSVLDLLKSSMVHEDYSYIKGIYKKNNINLNGKVPYKISGKHSILINGKDKAQFRMNGSEVLYKNRGFRLTKHWSMRKNIKSFITRLTQVKGMNVKNFLINKAYAGTEEENQRAENDALFLAMALDYTSRYMEVTGDDYRFRAEIAQDPMLHAAVSSLGPISNIRCNNIGIDSDGQNDGDLTVSYSSGGSIKINKFITQENGYREIYQVINTVNGWPTHLKLENESAFPVATAIRTFCNNTEKGQQALIQQLQGLQAEHGSAPDTGTAAPVSQ